MCLMLKNEVNPSLVINPLAFRQCGQLLRLLLVPFLSSVAEYSNRPLSATIEITTLYAVETPLSA